MPPVLPRLKKPAVDVSHAEPAARPEPRGECTTRIARPVVDEPCMLKSLADVGKECTGGLNNQHLLLTYAQCEIMPSLALKYLSSSRIVTGLACCREVHKDGNHHLHVFLQKKRTLLPWDSVLLPGVTKVHRPNVRSLTTSQHRYNVWVYLHKEGEVSLAKDFRVHHGRKSRRNCRPHRTFWTWRATRSIENALSQYVSEGGDLARVGPVQRGLQLMLRARPRAQDGKLMHLSWS